METVHDKYICMGTHFLQHYITTIVISITHVASERVHLLNSRVMGTSSAKEIYQLWYRNLAI